MSDYLFVFISSQVTWRAHNRLIRKNKKDLILAPYFHLSEWGGGGGGGYIAASVWMMISFIKMINPGRSSEELERPDLKSHLRSKTLIHDRMGKISRHSLFEQSLGAI